MVSSEIKAGDRVAPLEGTFPVERRMQVGTVKAVRDAGKSELDIIVVHFKRSGRRGAGTVSYSRHDLLRQATIAEIFG